MSHLSGAIELMNDFRQTDSDKIHYAALAKGVKHFKDTEKGREQMCEADIYAMMGILKSIQLMI